MNNNNTTTAETFTYNDTDSRLIKDSSFSDVIRHPEHIDDEIEFMLDSFGVEFPSEHKAYSHLNFIRDMEDYVLRVAANACRNLIAANKRGERNDLA